MTCGYCSKCYQLYSLKEGLFSSKPVYLKIFSQENKNSKFKVAVSDECSNKFFANRRYKNLSCINGYVKYGVIWFMTRYYEGIA